MKNFTRSFFTVIFIFCALCLQAQSKAYDHEAAEKAATEYIQEHAEYVFEGTVLEKKDFMHQETWYTSYLVRVEKTFQGKLHAETIELMSPTYQGSHSGGSLGIVGSTYTYMGNKMNAGYGLFGQSIFNTNNGQNINVWQYVNYNANRGSHYKKHIGFTPTVVFSFYSSSSRDKMVLFCDSVSSWYNFLEKAIGNDMKDFSQKSFEPVKDKTNSKKVEAKKTDYLKLAENAYNHRIIMVDRMLQRTDIKDNLELIKEVNELVAEQKAEYIAYLSKVRTEEAKLKLKIRRDKNITSKGMEIISKHFY